MSLIMCRRCVPERESGGWKCRDRRGDADERVAVEGLAEALHIAQLHRQIGFFRQTAGEILTIRTGW